MLALLSTPLLAQKEESKLGVEEIITLHRAGFSEDDLVQTIKKHGVPSLGGAELKQLEEKGVPKKVLGLLRTGPKISPLEKKLTVADVVLLVKAGISATEINKQIDRSGSRFDLTKEQIVDLALKGVPAPVIKKMLASSTEGKKAAEKQESLSLKDLRDMARAGWTSDQLLTRIKERKARFALRVDDLIDLTRDGVPEAVITYVWEHRLEKNSEPAKPEAEAPAPKKGEADDLLVHVEPAGGFSLTMPRGWAVHRENRGSNALLSFTEKGLEKPDELADGEIQVFQIRASDPKRLTRPNLVPIAENFLNRLVHSYRKKGMELAYMPRGEGMLSARHAVHYSVSSTTSSGDTREGELWVTWKNDRVFVLAYAHRSELRTSLRGPLSRCLRSFTIEGERELPAPGANDQETLTALFEAWRAAVVRRDYALFRRLLPAGSDTAKERMGFLSMGDRLTKQGTKVGLASVNVEDDIATLSVDVIRGAKKESIPLVFERRGAAFRLKH